MRHFHIINLANHRLNLFPSSAAIQLRKHTNLLFHAAARGDGFMGWPPVMGVGGKCGEPVNCTDDLNAGDGRTYITNYVNILQWHCG